MPKLDKMVLIPLPEANARVAALRSRPGPTGSRPGAGRGEVADLGRLQDRHQRHPHNWTWHLSRAEGSPWNDIRVRKAANLAIDREGMKELLSGLMIPAEGFFPPATNGSASRASSSNTSRKRPRSC